MANLTIETHRQRRLRDLAKRATERGDTPKPPSATRRALAQTQRTPVPSPHAVGGPAGTPGAGPRLPGLESPFTPEQNQEFLQRAIEQREGIESPFSPAAKRFLGPKTIEKLGDRPIVGESLTDIIERSRDDPRQPLTTRMGEVGEPFQGARFEQVLTGLQEPFEKGLPLDIQALEDAINGQYYGAPGSLGTIVEIIKKNAPETMAPFLGIILTISEELDRAAQTSGALLLSTEPAGWLLNIGGLFWSGFNSAVRDRARENRLAGMDTFNAALSAYTELAPQWQKIVASIALDPVNVVPGIGFGNLIAKVVRRVGNVSVHAARFSAEFGIDVARVSADVGRKVVRGIGPFVRRLVVDEKGAVKLPFPLIEGGSSELRIKRFLDAGLEGRSQAARSTIEAMGFEYEAIAGLRPDEFFLAIEAPKGAARKETARAFISSGVMKGDESQALALRLRRVLNKVGDVDESGMLFFEDFDALESFLRTGEYVPASITSPIRTPGAALYETVGRIVTEPLGDVPRPRIKGRSAKVEESVLAKRLRFAEKYSEEQIQITELGGEFKPFARLATESDPGTAARIAGNEARAIENVDEAQALVDQMIARKAEIPAEINEARGAVAPGATTQKAIDLEQELAEVNARLAGAQDALTRLGIAPPALPAGARFPGDAPRATAKAINDLKAAQRGLDQVVERQRAVLKQPASRAVRDEERKILKAHQDAIADLKQRFRFTDAEITAIVRGQPIPGRGPKGNLVTPQVPSTPRKAAPAAAARGVERGVEGEIARISSDAKLAIERARTGEEFSGEFLRGSGREVREAVFDPDGVQENILGDAVYATPDEAVAKRYGPNVSVVTIRLRNPLVLSNDTQYKALTKEAGLLSKTPLSSEEVEALRSVILNKGHDGVVIRVPPSEETGKWLGIAFTDDTVVDFSRTLAAPPAPTAAPAPAVPTTAPGAPISVAPEPPAPAAPTAAPGAAPPPSAQTPGLESLQAINDLEARRPGEFVATTKGGRRVVLDERGGEVSEGINLFEAGIWDVDDSARVSFDRMIGNIIPGPNARTTTGQPAKHLGEIDVGVSTPVPPAPARPRRTRTVIDRNGERTVVETGPEAPVTPAVGGQAAAPPSGPPPTSVDAGALPSPEPGSIGNRFAAPFLPFDEVMAGVAAPDNPFIRALAGRTGINPSALQNSALGRVVAAYQRQRVIAESLTNNILAAAFDAHAQRFTGAVRRPSGPLGAVVRGPLDMTADGVVRGTGKRWEDVFSNPDAYTLNPETRALIDDYLTVVDEVEQLRLDAGLKARGTRHHDGWFYVPRQVKETRGVTLQRPSSPALQRVFEEATEGAAAGVKYSNDPRANLHIHVQAAYREIADKQLADALEPLSVSIADLVPAAIRSRLSGALARRNAARDEVNRLRVPRVHRRGPAPPEETALRARLKAERAAAAAEAKAAETEYTTARAAFDKANARAQHAEVAPGALFGKTDEAISVRQWRERFFPTEDVHLLRKGVEEFFGPAPPLLRPVLPIVNTVRLMAAGVLDVAEPFIQGLPILAVDPKAWGKHALRHYQAFFDPTVQARFMRDHLETFQEMAQNGVPIGSDEFFQALRTGGGIPALFWMKFLPKGAEARELLRLGGKQSFGRFQSSYDTGLAVGRALVWEGARDLPRFADNPGELAAWLRNLTGGLDSRAIGVGPVQRALEAVFLAFSPRYIRSTLAWFADAVRPTSPRRLKALESLARMTAGVVMIYVTTGLAMGRSWDEIEEGLNPLNGKRFLSYEVNGDWIGVGGQVRAIMAFMAQMISTLAPGGKPISDLATTDPFDNPILQFYNSRGAPGVNIGGAFFEYGTGLDVLPYDTIDSLPDLGRHLGTSMLPFTVAGLLEGEHAMTAAFAFSGFRTSAQTAAEARNAVREQAMRAEGLLGATERYTREKWDALGADKRAPILELTEHKEAQDRVDVQRRDNRDQWLEYTDKRSAIDTETEKDVAAAVIEYGASPDFRERWFELQHDASVSKEQLRRFYDDLITTFKTEHPLFDEYSVSDIAERTGYAESYLLEVKNGWRSVTEIIRKKIAADLKRPVEELFTVEETEARAPFDTALDAFFAAVTSPDALDATGAVDYNERDALLRLYRAEVGDTMAERVEDYLRSTEPPLVQQLLSDLDVLREYWQVGRDFPLRGQFKVVWDKYLAANEPEKRSLQHQYPDIADWVKERTDQRNAMRNPENPNGIAIDLARVRWYGDNPRTQAGAVEFRRLWGTGEVLPDSAIPPAAETPAPQAPELTHRQRRLQLAGAAIPPAAETPAAEAPAPPAPELTHRQRRLQLAEAAR